MFRDIIVKEVYGSIFYLFMRNDELFLDLFRKNMKTVNFMMDDMVPLIKKMVKST